MLLKTKNLSQVKSSQNKPSVARPGSSGNEKRCSSIRSPCSLATISMKTSLFSEEVAELLLLLFVFLLDFFEVRETGVFTTGGGRVVLVEADRCFFGKSTRWSSNREPCDFKRSSKKSSPGPSARPS